MSRGGGVGTAWQVGSEDCDGFWACRGMWRRGGALVLRGVTLVLVESQGKGGTECLRDLRILGGDVLDLADGAGGSFTWGEYFLLGGFGRERQVLSSSLVTTGNENMEGFCC